MIDTVKGFTFKIKKIHRMLTDAPDGMFPKTHWTYFTYPSSKEPIKTLGREWDPVDK